MRAFLSRQALTILLTIIGSLVWFVIDYSNTSSFKFFTNFGAICFIIACFNFLFIEWTNERYNNKQEASIKGFIKAIAKVF